MPRVIQIPTDPEHQVEQIVSREDRNEGLFYLVKWKHHYKVTWQPLNNLQSQFTHIRDFERRIHQPSSTSHQNGHICVTSPSSTSHQNGHICVTSQKPPKPKTRKIFKKDLIFQHKPVKIEQPTEAKDQLGRPKDRPKDRQKRRRQSESKIENKQDSVNDEQERQIFLNREDRDKKDEENSMEQQGEFVKFYINFLDIQIKQFDLQMGNLLEFKSTTQKPTQKRKKMKRIIIDLDPIQSENEPQPQNEGIGIKMQSSSKVKIQHIDMQEQHMMEQANYLPFNLHEILSQMHRQYTQKQALQHLNPWYYPPHLVQVPKLLRSPTPISHHSLNDSHKQKLLTGNAQVLRLVEYEGKWTAEVGVAGETQPLYLDVEVLNIFGADIFVSFLKGLELNN